MAFTKKAKPANIVEEPAEEEEPALTDLEGTPVEAVGEGTSDADTDMMASLGTEDAEAAPENEGGESLLDMFTSVGIEVVDRSVLTDLAGEVEITDLISELNVVAAALGIVMGERAHHDELVEEVSLAA